MKTRGNEPIIRKTDLDFLPKCVPISRWLNVVVENTRAPPMFTVGEFALCHKVSLEVWIKGEAQGLQLRDLFGLLSKFLRKVYSGLLKHESYTLKNYLHDVIHPCWTDDERGKMILSSWVLFFQCGFVNSWALLRFLQGYFHQKWGILVDLDFCCSWWWLSWWLYVCCCRMSGLWWCHYDFHGGWLIHFLFLDFQ